MRRVASAREKWTRVIDDHRRSGLSVSVFCRERSLPASSFFAWRRKLGVRGATCGFVEARVIDHACSDAAGADAQGHATGVTIELAGGRRIGVAPGFDRQLLLEVIGVLEGRSAAPQGRSAALQEGSAAAGGAGSDPRGGTR